MSVETNPFERQITRAKQYILERLPFEHTALMGYHAEGGAYLLAATGWWSADNKPHDLVVLRPIPLNGTRVVPLYPDVNPDLIRALKNLLDDPSTDDTNDTNDIKEDAVSAWDEYTIDEIALRGPEGTVYAKTRDGGFLGVAAPYGEDFAVALNLTSYRLGSNDKWTRISNTEVYLEPDELDQLADQLKTLAERIRKNNDEKES